MSDEGTPVEGAPTDAPAEGSSTPKAAARAAAINRAAAPAAPDGPPADTSPGTDTPPQGDESAAPAKPTPVTDGAGTPPEVSEAARTLAKRRSQIKQEVVKELEAEGALEPGDVPVDDADAAPTDKEQLADAIGPIQLKEGSELPALPQGLEWVEIPEGNPLRDRGDTHFPVASGTAAEYVKSQLNNPIRNRDVEEANRRVRELERQIAQAEARRKARESEEARRLENPELKRLIEDAERAGYSQDTIELLKRGFEAQRRDIEEMAVQEVEQVEQLKDIARAFTSRVEQIAATRYNEWTRRGELGPRLRAAYDDYGDWIDSKGKMPDVNEFFRMFLDAEYASDPRVRAVMQERMNAGTKKDEEARQAELARIKQEIRDEILAEAEERRAKRDTNPLGRLPRTQSGSRTPREDGSEGISGLTPGQVKRAARDRALSRIGGG